MCRRQCAVGAVTAEVGGDGLGGGGDSEGGGGLMDADVLQEVPQQLHTFDTN